MKIICKTNIDSYKVMRNCFPEHLQYVPRVGENVKVVDSYVKHFESKKLPTILVVSSVTYTENNIIVDLHFSKNDFEMAKLEGVNLYNL